MELGPKDLEKDEARAVLRYNGAKQQMALSALSESIPSLLNAIQSDMLLKATKERDGLLKLVTEWKDFVPALDGKNLVMIPWCEQTPCEEQIKEKSARHAETDTPQDERAPSMGAKSLCIPFDQPKDRPIVEGQTKCVNCGAQAKRWTLFGRSY